MGWAVATGLAAALLPGATGALAQLANTNTNTVASHEVASNRFTTVDLQCVINSRRHYVVVVVVATGFAKAFKCMQKFVSTVSLQVAFVARFIQQNLHMLISFLRASGGRELHRAGRKSDQSQRFKFIARY
ncbi:MAG: hypothetical protein ACK5A0_13595 [Polaromonas sp.]|jgi:hypothetical protein